MEEYYPGPHQHQSYVEPNVPPVHVPEFMSQHHPSQAQYQSTSFSGHASQGCQQSFQPLGFSSYIPQYSFQVPSISNVFFGSSQMLATTFNTPPSTYNLAPLSSCYRPSLATQICDMSHEDEDENEDEDVLEAHVMCTLHVPLYFITLEKFVTSESGPFSIHIHLISL